jgi:hypothetical protein
MLFACPTPDFFADKYTLVPDYPASSAITSILQGRGRHGNFSDQPSLAATIVS